MGIGHWCVYTQIFGYIHRIFVPKYLICKTKQVEGVQYTSSNICIRPRCSVFTRSTHFRNNFLLYFSFFFACRKSLTLARLCSEKDAGACVWHMRIFFPSCLLKYGTALDFFLPLSFCFSSLPCAMQTRRIVETFSVVLVLVSYRYA